VLKDILLTLRGTGVLISSALCVNLSMESPRYSQCKFVLISSAVQEYEVRWGDLVEGRSEATAKRRWHLLRCLVPQNRDYEMPQAVRNSSLLALFPFALFCLELTAHSSNTCIYFCDILNVINWADEVPSPPGRVCRLWMLTEDFSPQRDMPHPSRYSAHVEIVQATGGANACPFSFV
jgi:hypothetical protein